MGTRAVPTEYSRGARSSIAGVTEGAPRVSARLYTMHACMNASQQEWMHLRVDRHATRLCPLGCDWAVCGDSRWQTPTSWACSLFSDHVSWAMASRTLARRSGAKSLQRRSTSQANANNLLTADCLDFVPF